MDIKMVGKCYKVWKEAYRVPFQVPFYRPSNMLQAQSVEPPSTSAVPFPFL